MSADSQPRFRRRKAERPAEILDAALAVFAEKGFAAARLEEIARLAGVSKGALYLYFATKEDLFRAVVGQAAFMRSARLTLWSTLFAPPSVRKRSASKNGSARP